MVLYFTGANIIIFSEVSKKLAIIDTQDVAVADYATCVQF